MYRTTKSMAVALTAALLLQACTDRPAPTDGAGGTLTADVAVPETDRYVVLFAAERVPAGFAERVAELGGSVEATLDGIGVVVAAGLTDAAAAALAGDPGVRRVEPDLAGPPAPPGEGGAGEVEELVASADATASPTTAQFYGRQWNLRAVSADVAWAAGHLGSSDVTVAILDTGIDYLHPELAGLVDLGRSTSFVPEDDPVIAARFPGRLAFSDLNYHGTAVASIVASNAVRLAGVNRHVTLLAVKIWNRSLQGPISRLLLGIVYAADQGADVINFSGNYTFDASENPGLVAAVERTVTYAVRRGAVVVSAAGNDGADLDHNGSTVRLPCQAPMVICVHATAPTAAGGLNGTWTNVDAPAGYSGFGRSAIDVAAPGGAGAVGSGRRVWVPCSSTTTETSAAPACIAGPGVNLAQPTGTSFAVPHVSGLAALLVAQLGHDKPALIRTQILQSADDLGEPGMDPYYGRGRINVARALGVID